eukprot:13152573-Ditylum_brightwellii.AAC.1
MMPSAHHQLSLRNMDWLSAPYHHTLPTLVMLAEAQPRHLHTNTSSILFNKQNYRHSPNKPNI